MARVIKAWCPSCLLIHGINFTLLILMLLLWPRRQKATAPAHSTLRDASPGLIVAAAHPSLRMAAITFILAFVTWAVCLTSVIGYKQPVQAAAYKNMLEDIVQKPEVLTALYWQQQKQEIAPPRDDPANGGTAELLVFSDMTCVACRRLEAVLTEQVEPLFGQGIRVVFKHYPLCKKYNSYVEVSLSPETCAAAYAAEAARLQGGEEMFTRMRNEIFGRAGELDDFVYSTVATLLGLDTAQFNKDRAGQAARDRVREDIELGHRLSVEQPPTIFLNGRRVSTVARDKIEFWEKIAGELAATTTPTGLSLADRHPVSQ